MESHSLCATFWSLEGQPSVLQDRWLFYLNAQIAISWKEVHKVFSQLFFGRVMKNSGGPWTLEVFNIECKTIENTLGRLSFSSLFSLSGCLTSISPISSLSCSVPFPLSLCSYPCSSLSLSLLVCSLPLSLCPSPSLLSLSFPSLPLKIYQICSKYWPFPTFPWHTT